LEIQPDTAGVGAEEKPAARVFAKGNNFAAPLFLRHGTGVPCITDSGFFRPFAHPRQHALPFRKNDGFDIRIGEAFVKNAGDFIELRAFATRIIF